MNFNIENIKALVMSAYLPHARMAFGDVGTVAITKLLDVVKLIYQRCPPERLPGTLTVVVGIEETTPLQPAISGLGQSTVLCSYEEVGIFLLESGTSTHSTVEIVADGTFRMVTLTSDYDLSVIALKGVLYRFEAGTERILAKTYVDFLPKVSPILLSNFAVPTLSSLEAALDYYAREMALETRCRILSPVWEGGVDGPRLVLVNKPEALMRDSLAHAIQLLTRDTSVRPEQNTDETKPVDIRVDWFASAASALIEVKWLGKSTAISRTPGPAPTYTEYAPPRAQSGAKQLADYMDREVRHTHAHSPRGYLVVFDARRRNVQGADDLLSKADALHYANVRLEYDPDYSAIRGDFAPPYRFYMRPRQSHFKADTAPL